MASPKSAHRLHETLQRFDITVADVDDVLPLKDYKIVIIADDSGSMQNSSFPEHIKHVAAYDRTAPQTRWAEMQQAIEEIVEVSACLKQEDGVDVYFLNRQPVFGVTSASDPRLQAEFDQRPIGGTPLTEAVQRFSKTLDPNEETLLLIFTDGEPNFGRKPFREALERLVRWHRVHVQILACTTDEGVVEWLSALDGQMSSVDVSDDFLDERREVIYAGLAPKYTRGDWCAKALLCPVSDKFASWNSVLHHRFPMTPLCDWSPCQIM